MNTQLIGMTVKDLREVAKRMGIKGYSTMKKEALQGFVSSWIELDHEAALIMDIEVEDAKIQTAEDEFYAAERARKIESGEIRIIDGVEFGSGWNCCKTNPAKIMTFADGGRWAVCLSCANSTGNTITHLSAEMIAEYKSPLKPVKVMNPTKRMKAYAAQVGGIKHVTPKQFKRILKKANVTLKRKGMFEIFPHLRTPSGIRKAEKAARKAS